MAGKDTWYSLDLDQLWKLVGQGTYEQQGASKALERARAIQQRGGQPAIYYSESSGFWVIDESDPAELQSSLRLGNKARRFPG